MGITETLKRWFQRTPEAQTAPGMMIGPQNAAPGIEDGVRYDLPVLLPRQLAEDLNARGKMGEYLRESAATSFRFQFDTPMRGVGDEPFMPPTEDPLREWSWGTREYVLTNTHAAYARNPIANRACKYVASFVVGDGFNLTCKAEEVRELLEQFIDSEDNQIRTYERQAPIDLLVDGEIMLRYFRGNDETEGLIAAVPQRPWECQYIKTERGFFRRRVSYRFQRYLTEGDSPTSGQQTEIEDVPADEILHVAINRHGYELRGRPELYAVLPWLRAYKEWLENRARQNHWRTSFMWFVQVKTTAASALASVAARWKRPPTPGSVAVESDAVNVMPLTNPVAAGDASEDGRQIKLMSAVGFGLPEYMLSDGSNANLASSTSQQLPALVTFADMQRTLIEELWYPLFKRVVQEAIDAGLIPEMCDECDADGEAIYDEEDDDAAEDMGVEDDADEPVLPMEKLPRRIKTIEAFDVSYTPIQDTNIQTLATALDILARNGWVDDETATTEAGFDYAIVQKRLRRDEAKSARDMAMGRKPTPPGMTPPGYDGAAEDDSEDGPNAVQQSAARPPASPAPDRPQAAAQPVGAPE
jgi:hypothetical protein